MTRGINRRQWLDPKGNWHEPNTIEDLTVEDIFDLGLLIAQGTFEPLPGDANAPQVAPNPVTVAETIDLPSYEVDANGIVETVPVAPVVVDEPVVEDHEVTTADFNESDIKG